MPSVNCYRGGNEDPGSKTRGIHGQYIVEPSDESRGLLPAKLPHDRTCG